MKAFLPLAFVLFAASCVGDDAMTKDEAREAATSGKADHTYDACEYYGWYGDGECDEFCAKPDTADCQVACASSDSCDDGYYCTTEDGECNGCDAPDGLNCPAVCLGVCAPYPDTDPTQCYSSANCDSGEHCSTEDGDCFSNCPPGFSCPAVCSGVCTEDVPACAGLSISECNDRDDCAIGFTNSIPGSLFCADA